MLVNSSQQTEAWCLPDCGWWVPTSFHFLEMCGFYKAYFLHTIIQSAGPDLKTVRCLGAFSEAWVVLGVFLASAVSFRCKVVSRWGRVAVAVPQGYTEGCGAALGPLLRGETCPPPCWHVVAAPCRCGYSQGHQHLHNAGTIHLSPNRVSVRSVS